MAIESSHARLDTDVSTEWSIDELICVCLARMIQNGDIVALGLATPLPAAAALLAQLAHAPDIYFASAIGQAVCRVGPTLGLTTAEEGWLEAALDSYGFVQAAADYLPSARPKEFFRPGQVDRAGNFNNIAFGKDHRKPRMRMPGVGGIPDVTVFMDQVHLYVPKHSRVTFVKELDYLSGIGHHEARRRGDGPRGLVTDLGQFDFQGGKMRLTHVHPGVTVARIAARTGFDLEQAEDLSETPLPTSGELQLLREHVDPLRLRRLELLGGAERRRELRRIIESEARR
jgi:glutaconate CoA-transferase subunit B